MSINLEISISKLVEETCNFINNACCNISSTTNTQKKFNTLVDEDYRKDKMLRNIELGSYFDSKNGNTLFGVKSSVDQPFKVGYQPELLSSEIDGINGAIQCYDDSTISNDLSSFLSECGMTIDTNKISQKQFLIFMSNIASFLMKHVKYFVEADKLNLNQLNPVDEKGNIPSTNISKNVLVVYVPSTITDNQDNPTPTLSEIINWNSYNSKFNDKIDTIDAESINAIMSNLFNTSLNIDRVKRYQYAMTVCSSSSSSSCCSSSSCSSSCSSSYFVAYMKLF